MKPMKARQEVMTQKDFQPGLWASEKYDGVRAVFDREKFAKSLRDDQCFTSNNEKPLVAPPEWHEPLYNLGYDLDGELWAGRGRFQIASGLCRRKAAELDTWREAGMRFVVFDLPFMPKPYSERFAFLVELAKQGRLPSFVELAVQVPYHKWESLIEHADYITGEGGEGLIVRNPADEYVFGRHSKTFKMKKRKETEAKVIGHQPGEGKHLGRLGALICEIPGTGVQFKVGTGFSDLERDDPPAVGSIITFSYMNLTPAGVPREPSYKTVRDYE